MRFFPRGLFALRPDGTFLRHLELPPRASLLAMRGDRGCGVVMDEDDVPYVERWQVDTRRE